MSPVDQDLLYLQSSMPYLEDFLIGRDIFVHLDVPQSVHGALIPSRLSLGGVLLARARLASVQPPGFTSLDAHMTTLRSRWRVNWETKAAQELPERVRLWSNALGELLSDQESARRAYPREVRMRVMIQLLADELSTIPQAVQAEVNAMDATLRAVFHPGEFCWDMELVAGFQKEKYWFLYGGLL